MKNTIIFLLVILPFNLFCQTKKVKTEKIKLTASEKKYFKTNDSCKCQKQIYRFENGFKLESTYVMFPCKIEYAFENKDKDCSSLKILYKQSIISLDSIYYSNCENDEIKYLPVFVSGTQKKIRNNSLIKLKFMNEALNSNKTTLHQFNIIINNKNNEIVSIKLLFL